MCTLNLFFKVFDQTPVLLLANREEFMDRPFSPPEMLTQVPRIFGPRDKAAGGTWIGVNEAGLIVALTNHYGTISTGGSSFCSRGFVVMEALRHATAKEARRLVEALSPRCKAFTLLIVDKDDAFVIDNPPTLGSTTFALMAGTHVITNDTFRDPKDVKARRCKKRMEELSANGYPNSLQMTEFLSDHKREEGQHTPLCVHSWEGTNFGTSSASAIAINSTGDTLGYWFSNGPPCENEFKNQAPDFGS
jgi:uncharacterized protein with NRDE domain